MEELLKRLVDGFGSRPLVARKAMLELLGTDRQAFGAAAVRLLRANQDGPGPQFLTTLLVSHDLVVDLAALRDGPPLDGVVHLARRAVKLDPLLEVKLVRRLLDAPESDVDGTRRLLETLGGLSDDPRVAKIIHRLQDNPNPRIRSKAALLLGRAFHDIRRAAELLREADPRVRANAVEANWGASGPEWAAVFRTAAADAHNRVSANGWLGLYLAGEMEAVAGLEGMARNGEAKFRQSAYWAMGHTGDPRFLATVEQASGGGRGSGGGGGPTSSAAEMAAAEKARTQLAASYQAARARPPLDLFLHQLAEKPGENEAEGGYERRLSLSAAVAGSGGGQAGPVQGLGPLRFLVRENGVPVSAYTAREVSPPDVLAVAFLLPCNTQLGDPPGRAALAEAARIHRRTDVWSVLRYRDGFRPPPDELAPALRFAGDPSSWVSGAHGYRGTAAPGLAAAVESIVPLLGVQRGTRHLIAVAGLDPVQEAPDPALLGELRGHLAANRIAFHAVVPASAPLGVLLAWQPLCRATGGWCAPNVAPDGIAAAVRRIAVAVLHRYDLAWTSGHAQPALSIEVLAPHGYGKLEFGNI